MSRDDGRAAAPDRSDLRARLERSRGELLDALARLTEQDFASEVDAGTSVVALLSRLAAEERAATGAGAPSISEASLAPQAVHQLAGSRHITLRALERGDGLDRIAAVAEREERAAARIRAAFRSARNSS